MEKLWPLKVRPYVTKAIPNDVPPVRLAKIGDGWVVHLPLDVTTGLLGDAQWGILGYEPSVALALMKNILLASANR
jgi:hypothetical protein